MKISIIIPVYNEEKYILDVLNRINIQRKNIDLEVIISDDASNDKTIEIIKQNNNLYEKLVENEVNKGKGSAIISALEYVTGDYVLIQDADLEYDPKDYIKLIEPIKEFNADVVYGSRFKGSEAKRILYFKNRIANFILSFLVSLITNINFSDVETGYKVIKSDILKTLNLKEKSFAIEIEITMKLAKKELKFYEVGISYNGRTFEEGKKIKMKDGFIALYKIFYYSFKK
tara:strand:+ start:110 stop:799 length:690 start_codon:yes stop_codon:yes gene_type:complete